MGSATRWREPVLLWALLASLPACSWLHRGLEAPEVFVSNVVPVSMGSFEQRVRVDLRIQNPNNVDLTLQGLRFDLFVNGQPLSRGTSGQTVELPRLGEAMVSVEATTTTFDLLRQALALGTAGSGSGYEVSGDVFVIRPVRTRLAFERSGPLLGGSP